MAKAKKITQKEFWQIIEEATGTTREVFEYGGLLNSLSILLDSSSRESLYKADETEDEERKQICRDFAEVQSRRARRIFEALKERGYYDDI